MREEAPTIKPGGKRLRHGTYKTVYLDNRGKSRDGTIRRDWRAEIQTIGPCGVVRLRGWFKNREDALHWLDGK